MKEILDFFKENNLSFDDTLSMIQTKKNTKKKLTENNDNKKTEETEIINPVNRKKKSLETLMLITMNLQFVLNQSTI